MRGLKFLEAMAGGALLSSILVAALAACDDDSDAGDATSDADVGDASGDVGLDLNPDLAGDTAADPDGAGDLSQSDGAPDAPQNCDASFTSNLEGVRIEIDDSRCIWTLAEAASIEIDWSLVIAEAVSDVRPDRQDGGGCGTPDESGLIPFERIAGGDQLYCMCDVGLCPGDPLPLVTLETGTYDHTFEWDGRNFEGPSDTGNEPGDPFPAGVYTLSISAIGERGDENPVPFEVEGTLEITIVP